MNINHQRTERLLVAVATLIVIPTVISLSAGLGLVNAGLQAAERWTREGGPIEKMQAVLYFLAFLGCLTGWGKEIRKGNFWRTPWLLATIIAFAIFAKERTRSKRCCKNGDGSGRNSEKASSSQTFSFRTCSH